MSQKTTIKIISNNWVTADHATSNRGYTASRTNSRLSETKRCLVLSLIDNNGDDSLLSVMGPPRRQTSLTPADLSPGHITPYLIPQKRRNSVRLRSTITAHAVAAAHPIMSWNAHDSRLDCPKCPPSNLKPMKVCISGFVWAIRDSTCHKNVMFPVRTVGVYHQIFIWKLPKLPAELEHDITQSYK